MIDLKQDYFALFGLVPAFSIDMERLEQAYIDIQARVHPDRFAHLSDTEKRLSMQWATHAASPRSRRRASTRPTVR
jgi:molecular chaperone HscB